jgi:hypothetical protein
VAARLTEGTDRFRDRTGVLPSGNERIGEGGGRREEDEASCSLMWVAGVTWSGVACGGAGGAGRGLFFSWRALRAGPPHKAAAHAN